MFFFEKKKYEKTIELIFIEASVNKAEDDPKHR